MWVRCPGLPVDGRCGHGGARRPHPHTVQTGTDQVAIVGGGAPQVGDQHRRLHEDRPGKPAQEHKSPGLPAHGGPRPEESGVGT